MKNKSCICGSKHFVWFIDFYTARILCYEDYNVYSEPTPLEKYYNEDYPQEVYPQATCYKCNRPVDKLPKLLLCYKEKRT